MFKRPGSDKWHMCIRVNGRKVQKSLGTSDKKAALNYEAKIRAELAERKFLDIKPGHKKTFAEMAQRYLMEYTPAKAPRSGERDECLFRLHLVPFFGAMTVCDIGARHIADYRAKRKAEKVAPATLNKELGLMKAAYNVAIREWEWLDSNPVCRIRMEKVDNTRVRYLTKEQSEKLLAACEDWLRPMVMVARYTGMRKGNLLALEWGDINLFQKKIRLGTTKNGEPLGMPICGKILAVFMDLRKVSHLKSQLVFHEADGSMIGIMKLQRAFKKACKDSGLLDFRWHDLRHDFASQLAQKGVGIYKIQQLLGHKDGRVTQRYAHLSPENLRDAVNVLDEDDYNLTTVGVSGEGKEALNA